MSKFELRVRTYLSGSTAGHVPLEGRQKITIRAATYHIMPTGTLVFYNSKDTWDEDAILRVFAPGYWLSIMEVKCECK